MNITGQKLLRKMEQELLAAKQSGSQQKQREHIQAIKALCELVLDSQGEEVQVRRPVPVVTEFPSQPVPFVQTIQPQPKKVEMDDEANGDSLLDF